MSFLSANLELDVAWLQADLRSALHTNRGQAVLCLCHGVQGACRAVVWEAAG